MHILHADLRAFVDEELPAAERAAAASHLAACPDCAVRLQAVSAQTLRVSQRLAVLAPSPADAPAPAHAAHQQLQYRQRKDGIPMLKSLAARRPLWAGLAAVAALAVLFSFAPVRAWAGQFLGLFRVQQIRVLPLDTTGLSALADNATLSEQISQLFADNVTILHEPASPVTVSSLEAASQMAGFTVRGLSAGGAQTTITVRDGLAFQVVPDRARAQAILNEAGRADLQLPASLDGAAIRVDVPTGVTIAYGQCPLDSEAAVESGLDPDRPTGRSSFRSCVLFAQVPSPTVTAPPDLNVAELAELALQFVGLSPEEAREFSATVDWTSTLVVPLPRQAAAYALVEIDGVSGTLVYQQRDPAVEQFYVLMWVKDDVVYALQAFGRRADVLALANSVR